MANSTAYDRGYADAGRFGVRGEWTDIADAQRDDYAAGVAQAQVDRAKPLPSPWVKA